MGPLAEKVIERVPSGIFTDTTVRRLIQGTPHSRYGLVKRALRSGEIIHLRRGLYVLSKKYQRRPVNLYEIAQRIYGPSYISFASALSYHGWIPEAVYTVTSACAKRSKDVKTPLGLFSYTRIPSTKFYAGVDRISSSEGIFLMADPWRALMDYIYVHKKNWNSLKPVVESLRVDPGHLRKVDFSLLKALRESTHSRCVKQFIDSVRKELRG